ncbi:hypothetical protein H5410_005506 [Solanum commersonii]|uniref:Uncharacterized protein n=1 Tax=Solanum commersonii TaxID=4109 RepID=A0A9J6A7C6_SOLCO|nr:hypothetical protein H5410_005506 [Solanum commersonii]
MQHVQARKYKKVIVLNRYKKLIGPTKSVLAELGSFLRTLARSEIIYPLNINRWSNVDAGKDLWKNTLVCFLIP